MTGRWLDTSMTTTQATARQVYVLPTPEGWACVTYGDELVPDDVVIPLPCTSAMSYEDVLAFVASTPIGQGAFIDGWPTVEMLAEYEPELAARGAR